MKNLIHMANQIGSFFEAMPDREEALQGIAGHLQRFWEPRMRSQLLGYVDAENGKDLKPIVVSAIRAHRSSWLSRE
ncbi:MAG TPA: formate dehydrogenase subunit delta [Gallionella sp.]|nr:formate dehydrogenase subunit delta [Gallionella sp.]